MSHQFGRSLKRDVCTCTHNTTKNTHLRKWKNIEKIAPCFVPHGQTWGWRWKRQRSTSCADESLWSHPTFYHQFRRRAAIKSLNCCYYWSTSFLVYVYMHVSVCIHPIGCYRKMGGVSAFKKEANTEVPKPYNWSLGPAGSAKVGCKMTTNDSPDGREKNNQSIQSILLNLL